MNRRLCSAALCTALLILPGCGAADEAPPSSAASSAPTSSAAEAGPEGLVVDITIAGGTVTPTNAAMDAKVGEPIVLVVSSDADDELHVHSSPEHSFEVKPGAAQRFEFTVDVPGRVDVELHHAGRTVVTISVTP